MEAGRWTISIVVITSLAAVSSPATAIYYPPPPLRTQATESDVIVVAEPVDAASLQSTGAFRVLEVIRGPGVAVGDRLIVDRDGGRFSSEVEAKPEPKADEKESTDGSAYRFKKVLFLLAYPKDSIGSLEPVDRVVRRASMPFALDDRGQIRRFDQWFPGFHQTSRLDWDQMLRDLRRDVVEIDGIHAIGRIADPAQRNRVIFEWLERHEADVKQPSNLGPKPATCWGTLDHQMFDWIMENMVVEDCWRALQLAREWNLSLQIPHPSFATQRGRAFLADIAIDERRPEMDRRDALAWLARTNTHWPRPHDMTLLQNHLARCIDEPEQRALWTKLQPLLDHADAEWRIAALKVASAASNPDRYSPIGELSIAMPRLLKMFLEENDPQVRAELMQTISRIESRGARLHYQDNPQGIAAVLIYRGAAGDKLRFELVSRSTIKLQELPRFVYGARSYGSSFHSDRSVVPDLEPPASIPTDGWGSGSMFLTIPSKLLYNEQWPYDEGQVTAVGKIGKDAEPWRSETTIFRLPENLRRRPTSRRE